MKPHRTAGQVIVMVTVAILALCGMLAFAVDFGWAFFVKRAAQRAADTAALAAAHNGLAAFGSTGTFTCGATLVCQAPTACAAGIVSPQSNVEIGCVYAEQNGFATGGHAGRQTVTIESNVPASGCMNASPPNCVPTAPGVAAYYWVTVRVTENIPQLFSVVLGRPTALAAARATAALVDTAAVGSLILLNRENDASPVTGRGVDLTGQGGSRIDVPGGIILSSQCYGANCGGRYAGRLQGGQELTSPFTFIRGTGQACAGNLGCTSQSSWIQPPINGKPTGDRIFMDPMRGKGQPGLPTIALQGIPIAGGTIPGGTEANPTILGSGSYYATAQDKKGNVYATGQPITLGSGYFRFGSCNAGFGDYIFFGGLRSGSSHTVATFAPGRYVLAGQTAGSGEPLFELTNGTTVQDCTVGGGQNSDAGEIFIFTDANYPGMDVHIANAPLVSAIRSNLLFGTAGIKTGNNDRSVVTLHGLNDQSADVKNAGLEAFSPVLFWQDQRNSRIRYDSNGNIDISCGNLDNPCTNAPENDPNREMFLLANSNITLYGATYQPRGAWLVMQAGGSSSGALQVITGAIHLQGSPPLTLTQPSNPITMRVAALVE